MSVKDNYIFTFSLSDIKMWLPFSLLLLSIFQLGASYNVEEAAQEDLLDIFNNKPLTVREIQIGPVTPDKIKYYLYTSADPSTYTIIDTANPQLRRDVPIVFFFHGFRDTAQNFLAMRVKNAFLRNDHRYHVIIVDWDLYADQLLYLVAARDCRDVGQYAAQFIYKLHTNFGIPLENIDVVGHSLGGQLLGFLGKEFQHLANKPLPRIFALDPAGPEFEGKPPSQRLNPDDAAFVYVIHTNGKGLGYDDPCGDIDFFPNGGRFQAGCLTTFFTNATDFVTNIMCSHIRAVDLFVVAVDNNHAFLSRKCSSWHQYQNSPNSCPQQFEFMGNLQTTKNGRFYCRTGMREPF